MNAKTLVKPDDQLELTEAVRYFFHTINRVYMRISLKLHLWHLNFHSGTERGDNSHPYCKQPPRTTEHSAIQLQGEHI